MGKTFIFLRGIDKNGKRQAYQKLMGLLNPNPNTVRAISFSLSDLVPDPVNAEKDELRAADRTIKNRIKRILAGGMEEFIVIDNESLMPANWQSFITFAKDIGELATVVGIDIYMSEENLSTDDKRRLNLQQRNSAPFKSDCDKYFEIKLDDTLEQNIVSIGKELGIHN